mmetsp:Transcript_13706/g.48380  ORF Transcript_13706/g.48380 Transcript_13706/m.48380 type:complete len:147 (-) Transcript_13706:140-580(-)
MVGSENTTQVALPSFLALSYVRNTTAGACFTQVYRAAARNPASSLGSLMVIGVVLVVVTFAWVQSESRRPDHHDFHADIGYMGAMPPLKPTSSVSPGGMGMTGVGAGMPGGSVAAPGHVASGGPPVRNMPKGPSPMMRRQAQAACC